MDLPAIEEAADKENDTFAVGGPLAGLARAIGQEKRDQSRDRSGIRSASSGKKPPIGSMVPKSVDVGEKYKMYREPGDNESVGVGLLAQRERA